MRFPTSSGLLCRHSALFKTPNIRKLGLISSQPASSLSAIHHGLRDSQKSKPQGYHKSSLEPGRPRRDSRSSARGNREDWTPPTFKMKRGKKDVTETRPKPPSRRSRFNDPEYSFGKKSLVYQMKHGALKGQVAGLQGSDRPRSRPERLSTDDFMNDFKGGPDRGTKFTRAGGTGRDFPTRAPPFPRSEERQGFVHRRNFEKDSSKRAHSSPPEFQREGFTARPPFQPRSETSTDRPEYSSRNRNSSNERGSRQVQGDWNRGERSPRQVQGDWNRGERSPRQMQGDWNRGERGPRQVQEDGNRDEQGFRKMQEGGNTDEPSFQKVQEDGNRDEPSFRKVLDGWKGVEGPVRIPRTTAASQFLYGRSVVEAALKTMRRQLYKLYIYDGDHRQGLAQDAALAALAQRRKVEVVQVPNDGLRMMDKMSEGRPHNGCILEASPLPQLPLKSLGFLSEDPKTPGFHVQIARQSSEEAGVNGTSDLVPYRLPKERNPFVLLLDGILDPGNLGGILRTVAFLGVNGVAITKSDSATLTPVALKASAGASEAVTLFSVDSTVDFLDKSKEKGWLVYAAVPETKWSRGNSHLTVDRVEIYDPLASQPTLLVVGSEGAGLNRPIRRMADHLVSIPGPYGGAANLVDSLNVAVATGILCSAFLKKQSSLFGRIIETEEGQPESGDESEAKLW